MPEAPATTTSPLTEAHWRDILAARKRAAPIRRAVAIARFDAWMTSIFAMMALVFVAGSSYFGISIAGLVVGVGLTAVAYNAFRGAGELRRFDPFGPRRLGFNQIALFLVITLYCAIQLLTIIYTGSAAIDAFEKYMNELADVNRQLGNSAPATSNARTMVQWAVGLVYGAIVFVSFFYQGLMAMYYFSRAKHIREFVEKTPKWVVELNRNLAS